jgi:signal transduction histidine kinase
VVDTDRYVEADSARLTRLLENLLRNAIEHGGDVSTVTVGDLDDGFYVADDGDGVPEADREQIFEDGYTTSSEGTGLGLSIVAEIVDDHDWAMAVTESADGGARFEIRTGEMSD